MTKLDQVKVLLRVIYLDTGVTNSVTIQLTLFCYV